MEETTNTTPTATPAMLGANLTYMLNVQETGQTFPLPASIATDDNLIKRSLASVIPYIDTAKLERSEPKDSVVTITVTKTHAPKGAGASGSAGRSTPRSGRTAARSVRGCRVDGGRVARSCRGGHRHRAAGLRGIVRRAAGQVFSHGRVVLDRGRTTGEGQSQRGPEHHPVS